MEHILRALQPGEEFIAWEQGGIQRRVRKQGDYYGIYELYDVQPATQTVWFYRLEMIHGAVRFCRSDARAVQNALQWHPILCAHEPTPWQQQHNIKARKRLFYNRYGPRLFRGVRGAVTPTPGNNRTTIGQRAAPAARDPTPVRAAGVGASRREKGADHATTRLRAAAVSPRAKARAPAVPVGHFSNVVFVDFSARTKKTPRVAARGRMSRADSESE